ncbi:MAG: hypothetical protein Q9201_002061 [Fulgogasparrea decipioides]
MNAVTDPTGSLYIQQLAEELRARTQHSSSTTVASTVLLVVLGFQLFYWLDYPILSMSELLWNSAVQATPSRVITALESALLPDTTDEARHDAEQSDSKRHAQKSATIRRLLGLEGNGILSKIQRARGGHAASIFFPSKSNASPPGLGNWDNSCYQNSVIQGLASLPSFSVFLQYSGPGQPSQSTKAALGDIIVKLKDQANLGTMFWTPAELKSMSSWQQQDAQEYFSKLMDDIERETVKSANGEARLVGLAAIRTLSQMAPDSSTPETNKADRPQVPVADRFQALSQLPDELQAITAKNPLEGLLAQRVGCLKCGFVEGLSLIPFNCLTLPLGKQWFYDIRSCLDEYTALEPINGVDCVKCTLLQSKAQLERLRNQFLDEPARELQASAPAVTEALKASVEERLHAVNEALENDDFSDNTILKNCQIPQKSKVSSTKTRQAVIARAPKSLAIHINRSVFNEMTGMLSKNYADVRFPLRFSLTPWCLGGGDGVEQWNSIPSESMLPDDIDEGERPAQKMYELRAALTHYGRHENGHYVCYRKHEINAKIDSKEPKGHDRSWWRFSDEDVSAVSEDNVLAQGDVFMLFYERVDESLPPTAPPTTYDDPPVQQPIPTAATAKIKSNTSDDSIVHRDIDNQSTAPTAEGDYEFLDTDQADQGVDATRSDPPIITDIPAQPATAVQDNKKDDMTSPGGLEAHPAPVPDGETSSLINQKPPETSILELSVHENLSYEATAETANPTPSATADDTASSFTERGIDPQPRSQELPKSEIQSFSPTMRTATPRSGRGSVSRSKKGMGQVSSSMVTAN